MGARFVWTPNLSVWGPLNSLSFSVDHVLGPEDAHDVRRRRQCVRRAPALGEATPCLLALPEGDDAESPRRSARRRARSGRREPARRGQTRRARTAPSSLPRSRMTWTEPRSERLSPALAAALRPAGSGR